VESHGYPIDVSDRDVLLGLHMSDVELKELRIDAEGREVKDLAGLHDGSVHGCRFKNYLSEVISEAFKST
jgi:hypothetical protein